MPEEPAGAADPPLRLRSHWPVVVLAVVAAVIAAVAHELLFPALSWNRDEPVYLWHVEVLRQGRLTAPDGGFPDLFHPWLSAVRDGEMFTQYTLGWPVVLLTARVLTGTPASALPVGAALAVAGTYALAFELTQRRRTAVLAGALLVASPILAIQGGAYLSYLFTLGLGLSAGALLLSGVRRARPGRHVAAGMLLGVVFITRPYDALLWGAAFALGLLLTARTKRRDSLRALLLVAVSALPLVVVTLLYNLRITGEALTFPITVADPLDGFGFGTRRLMPGFDPVDYGVWTALRATAKNGFLLSWFLVGGYLGGVVALAGLWIRRRDPLAKVLLLVAAAFPLGYFVFWGTYLSSLASRISGPIYLVPVYGVVSILAGAAIDHWWARSRRIAVTVLAVLAVATIPGAVTRFDVNREVSERQEAWRASVDELTGPSLVFVADTGTYLLYANPFSSNGPDLDGEVLYASAGSSRMLDLIAEEEARTPYLQQASVASPELGPREDPYDLGVRLVPIEVERAEELALDIAVAPPSGTEAVELEVDTGAESVRQRLDADPDVLQVRIPLGGTTEGSLAMSDRGRVIITVRFEGSDGEERGIPVRRVSPYRTDGSALELVTPFEAQRYERLDEDTRQWRFVADLPEVVVDVSAATG